MREELLVKAALLRGDSALHAWEQFVKEPPLRLDEYPKLLPLVYYNLKSCQKPFTHRETLRRVAMTTHAKNLYLLKSLKIPLSKFVEEKIPVIALKGLAYLTLYYQDFGAREITDIDLLVPPEHFYRAAQILEDLGWKTFRCRQLRHYNPRLMHALDYFDANANNIDLHSHLLHTNCGQTADEAYWDAAVDFDFQGIPMKTLSPTDHLIHASAHGQISNSAHSPYWAIDAIRILEKEKIDWERVLKLAREKAISLFLLKAFQFLNTYVPGTVPESILDALRAIPVSSLDQRIFSLLERQEKKLSYHQYLFCNAYRNSEDKTFLSCFKEYLKLIGSTDRLLLVPFTLTVKIAKKGAAWLKRSLS